MCKYRFIKHVWLLFIACLLGCDSSTRLWEEQQPLPDGIWYSKQALVFPFSIEQAQVPYTLLLTTHYTTDYPYQNMYIFYTLSNDQGKMLQERLIEAHFFDDFQGMPLGRGSAGLFFKEDTLLRGYVFEEKGHYKVSFRQFMRVDSLVGIRNIGLRIDQAR